MRSFPNWPRGHRPHCSGVFRWSPAVGEFLDRDDLTSPEVGWPRNIQSRGVLTPAPFSPDPSPPKLSKIIEFQFMEVFLTLISLQ